MSASTEVANWRLAAPLGAAFDERRRYNQNMWTEEKGGVASWVSTSTWRRPSTKETPPGAEDHNPATIVKPDMGVVEKVCAEQVQRFIQAVFGRRGYRLKRAAEFYSTGCRGSARGAKPCAVAKVQISLSPDPYLAHSPPG